MVTKLVGDDRAVEVGGVLLRAPELAGTLSADGPRAAASRRGGVPQRAGEPGRGAAGSAAIGQALRRQGMRASRTIRIAAPRDAPPRARARREAPPPMTVTVRAPRAGREQVILSVDEHGIASWHFAEKQQPDRRGDSGPGGGRRAAGGPATRTYVIPRTAAGPERGRRGFPGLDKLIQVITFPIAKAAGEVARFAVREWDTAHHPPRVRRFGPDGSLTDLDGDAWTALEGGRTLLFVHGTFSSTEGGFRALPRTTLAELNGRYGNRVIAYDHPTIADDPIANARWFLQQAGARRLDLDVVCHSRGGLVTRSLAERPGDLAALAPHVHVGTAVLVGSASNGTILASADRWNELVDRTTTILSFLPVPAAVDALETVFALVRSIAVQTAKNLEGLDAMVPGGDFLTLLNQAPAAESFRYRAVVSDFEPKNPGLAAWLNDASRDWLFENQPNDMLVAIDSMIGRDLAGPFPVTEICAFAPADGVEHADYFGQGRTSQALLDWLTGQP